MRAIQKNRLIFFLILIHIFLGISNLITSNIILGKSFDLQISSYVSLLIYGFMGFFLLLRKNWMRVLFIVLFFISVPLSLLSLRPNILLINNLLQLGISTCVVILLFNKELKTLYVNGKNKPSKPKKIIDGVKLATGDLLSNIESISNPKNAYITDMECVDDVSNYKDVISNILGMVGINDVTI